MKCILKFHTAHLRRTQGVRGCSGVSRPEDGAIRLATHRSPFGGINDLRRRVRDSVGGDGEDWGGGVIPREGEGADEAALLSFGRTRRASGGRRPSRTSAIDFYFGRKRARTRVSSETNREGCGTESLSEAAEDKAGLGKLRIGLDRRKIGCFLF